MHTVVDLQERITLHWYPNQIHALYHDSVYTHLQIVNDNVTLIVINHKTVNQCVNNTHTHIRNMSTNTSNTKQNTRKIYNFNHSFAKSINYLYNYCGGSYSLIAKH